MLSILKREIHSFFLSPFAYAITAVFLLIFALTFVPGLSNLSADNVSASGKMVYVFQFSSVIYKNFFFFMFLIPALTMRSFAEERKSGTEILLMTNPLDNFQIVLGKFLALAAIWLVMLIASLIYPIFIIGNGDINWSSLFCCYIGFLAWGLVCIAIGMLMSAFTQNPVIAAILGEMAMLALLFVDYISTTLKYGSMGTVSKILTWLSVQSRFEMFSKGILTVADLTYYITLIAVVLGWTVILLEKRKYNR